MESLELQRRILEVNTLKKEMGFKSHVAFTQTEIDLDRLSLLIDPTTTTRLYSRKKYIGPLLTFMRTSLVKVLYFMFRLDFSRLIELHQNVWILAYQNKQMLDRIEALEKELKIMKNIP